MKRPRYWLRWLLFLCVIFVIGEHVALTWWAPRYILHATERVLGDTLSVDRVLLSPLPLTARFDGLRLVHNRPEAAVTMQQVIMTPHRLSLRSKALWIDTVEIRQPVLRFTRSRDGTIQWPPLSMPLVSYQSTPTFMSSAWRIHIGSLKIVDGTIEFVDEHPSQPFRGLLDHISFEIGPLVLPGSSAYTSFAAVAQAVGDGGHVAPVYCSGWMAPSTKDVQISCRMDTLPLAAFEPYYHGPPEVRVYSTTLKATSQWSARANVLQGRIQLMLEQLGEGDLSFRGRTIVDVKKLMAGSPNPRLSGEVSVAGLLDHPKEWRALFTPGDPYIQELVERLKEHRIRSIRLAFGPLESHVNIVPPEPTIIDIEPASKEVQEALEVLAGPPPEAVPPTIVEPSGEATVEPTAPTLPESALAAPVPVDVPPVSEPALPQATEEVPVATPPTPPPPPAPEIPVQPPTSTSP